MIKRIFLVSTFFILAVLKIFSFQWPSDPQALDKTFAQPYSGGIFYGLEFNSPREVKPFDQGKVLYRYSPDPFSPLAIRDSSLLIIEHDNGFQSLYQGLPSQDIDHLSSELYSYEIISQDTDIGRYGFFIRDARLGRLVNPLLLLPGLNDGIPPELYRLTLMDSDGLEFPVMNEMSIPAGVYQVYARVLDRLGKSSVPEVLPFSLSLYNLGTLLAQRRMDTLVQSEQRLSLQDGVPLENLFNSLGDLYLGQITLNSGSASFELVMEDFFGNEKTVILNFNVLRQ